MIKPVLRLLMTISACCCNSQLLLLPLYAATHASRRGYQLLCENKNECIIREYDHEETNLLTDDDKDSNNGLRLAASVKNICQIVTDTSSGTFFAMLGFVDKKILYCPVEKCATTFWKRSLHLLTKRAKASYTNPYDVPFSLFRTLDKDIFIQRGFRNVSDEIAVRQNSFKFLFVRNPYSRLFATFVDKLLSPDPYFWKLFGVKAISQFRNHTSGKNHTSVKSASTGYDVTFAEYVKLVIKSLQAKQNLDEHYIPIFDKCAVCKVEYDFIGKLETFPEDSIYILKELGLNTTVETFASSKVSKSMAVDDAIKYAIHWPYEWRRQIVMTITWGTALRRIWLCLQLRGLIDLDQMFEDYIPEDKINTISKSNFQRQALNAHKHSDVDILKKQKVEAQREAFLTLHISDIKLLRDLYKNDFELIHYEGSPDELFNRPDQPQNATKYFTYYNWL